MKHAYHGVTIVTIITFNNSITITDAIAKVELKLFDETVRFISRKTGSSASVGRGRLHYDKLNSSRVP